jgi:uncharacterized protein YhhL (DUF1145 family)
MGITIFLWAVFIANVSYPLPAILQRLISVAYPAAQHHVNAAILSLITLYIITAATSTM